MINWFYSDRSQSCSQMCTKKHLKNIFEPERNEGHEDHWLMYLLAKRFVNLCQEIEYKIFGTHTTEAETSFEIEAWNWI